MPGVVATRQLRHASVFLRNDAIAFRAPLRFFRACQVVLSAIVPGRTCRLRDAGRIRGEEEQRRQNQQHAKADRADARSAAALDAAGGYRREISASFDHGPMPRASSCHLWRRLNALPPRSQWRFGSRSCRKSPSSRTRFGFPRRRPNEAAIRSRSDQCARRDRPSGGDPRRCPRRKPGIRQPSVRAPASRRRCDANGAAYR